MLNARAVLANLGFGILGPLGLVALTGIPMLFWYDADPASGVQGRLAPSLVEEFTRSIHLWSSRAVLAAAAFHLVRVLHLRLVSGPHRRTYLWGAASLGALAAAHFTGSILAWQPGGRGLVAYEASALTAIGLSRFLPQTDRGLLDVHLPFHAFILPAAALACIAVHVATVRGGLLVRAEEEPGLRRPEAAVQTAALIGVLAFLAGVAWRGTGEGTPWPWGPFASIAGVLGRPALFAALALVVLASVGTQPWLSRWPRATMATNWLLVILFGWAFADAWTLD